MKTVNIHQANPALEARGRGRGRRRGRPGARRSAGRRIVPLAGPTPERRFGAMKGRAATSEAFFEPLPDGTRRLELSRPWHRSSWTPTRSSGGSTATSACRPSPEQRLPTAPARYWSALPRLGRSPPSTVLASCPAPPTWRATSPGALPPKASRSRSPCATPAQERLPGPHRDPFDRMLIAQALRADLELVSNETMFDAYGVRRLW